MRTLSRMLKAAVSSRPHRKAIRKMIILKDEESYNACILELQKFGIKPVKQVDSANMLCCHMDGNHQALMRLKKHPHVRRIETDAKVRAHLSPFFYYPTDFNLDSITTEASSATNQIPWGIKRIQVPPVWKKSQGKSIKVAIVDTGISTHPDLQIAGGVNTIHKGSPYKDDNGHGTHVAGIVAALGKNGMQYGVAPEVKLYAVKVLDKNGDGYVSDIVEGLEWCIRNKMDVINMSLGLNGASASLRTMVKRAHRNGIVIVSSAGNEGKSSKKIDQPASYPEVIAVAATDKKNRIASFSSRGRGIDVAAPGSDIVSTSNKKGFVANSGTSMAAPHVSGTVALLLAHNRKISPAHVRKLLINHARPLKGYSRISQGFGLIQAEQAFSALSIASQPAAEASNSYELAPAMATPIAPYMAIASSRSNRSKKTAAVQRRKRNRAARRTLVVERRITANSRKRASVAMRKE
ncbi:S8 family peptidase [Paenibacillus alvei]|uniref:S8 family peptidase n=1 Tax=Paenibacillus alvei TaxID=44250 RepID=A0AAP6ZR89_PAEAL|nr:S8 family peptidase [Paenibacillus alvei]NOJ69108.1 S8 family peptidase [Paenibacillus alvei]